MNIQFTSFADFIYMGGHGFAVWSAWLLAIIVVVAMIIYAIQQRKQVLAAIKQQQAYQRNRQSNRNR